MNFLKPSLTIQDKTDPVFGTLQTYYQIKNDFPNLTLTNATLGSLVNEAGELFTYQSFYNIFKNLDNKVHAAYAQDLIGNPDFLKVIEKWVLNDEITISTNTMATSGGSGAIAAALTVFPLENETVLIPEIGWSSYELMCETRNLTPTYYQLFDDENNFDLINFKKQVKAIIETQKRLTIIINDPAHNPTGYSLDILTWQKIIDYLNTFTSYPIILINDVAYLDYTNDLKKGREYLKVFNNIKPHLLVGIAVSLSKTVSVYGQRLGALITITPNKNAHEKVKVALANYARATWSNVNNAAMVSFTKMINENLKDFLKENKTAVVLIKERSTIFLNEAKEVKLPLYPYKEGFFVTIKVFNNDFRDKYHQALIENHIFTVPVNLGIRIALCGLPSPYIRGLAKKLMQIYQNINKGLNL